MASDTPEETRERILNRSIPLFAQSGFDGVSMRDVARAVGVTAAALYYHFPDKEQLYLAMVEHGFNNRIPPTLDEAGQLAGSWNRLEAFIVHFTRTLAADRDFQRLMQWVLLDTDDVRSQKLVDQVFAPFFVVMQGMVAEVDPRQDAHMLAVSIFSLVVFPFETSHARRFLPGYVAPQENPDALAQHVIALLRNGAAGGRK